MAAKMSRLESVPFPLRHLRDHEPRIRGVYLLQDVVGNRFYSRVWSACNMLTGEDVAIKIEIANPKIVPSLPHEAQMYRLVQGHDGFPTIRWAGMYGGGHVMVLDRLGPMLQDLLHLCLGKLSRKTILMMVLQMLDRVGFTHSRGIVHRDIKPENFGMDVGTCSGIVHLFDFGLAKLYLDASTGDHIPFREGRRRIGTMHVASYNMHYGRGQYRRDDLEMLGHSLLHLLQNCPGKPSMRRTLMLGSSAWAR
ncbi:kinase-like protein [Artomyces pyxidatus]|uniref:Kinase-like protein n=1 Tax=Artomyces pyxidatus TaxID=48021 RepID=A0ACB8SUT0_9AGAM|nr:kinase-like protein [Artomyces pyxidatus]